VVNRVANVFTALGTVGAVVVALGLALGWIGRKGSLEVFQDDHPPDSHHIMSTGVQTFPSYSQFSPEGNTSNVRPNESSTSYGDRDPIDMIADFQTANRAAGGDPCCACHEENNEGAETSCAIPNQVINGSNSVEAIDSVWSTRCSPGVY
jgi:hypothetical protein